MVPVLVFSIRKRVGLPRYMHNSNYYKGKYMYQRNPFLSYQISRKFGPVGNTAVLTKPLRTMFNRPTFTPTHNFWQPMRKVWIALAVWSQFVRWEFVLEDGRYCVLWQHTIWFLQLLVYNDIRPVELLHPPIPCHCLHSHLTQGSALPVSARSLDGLC